MLSQLYTRLADKFLRGHGADMSHFEQKYVADSFPREGVVVEL